MVGNNKYLKAPSPPKKNSHKMRKSVTNPSAVTFEVQQFFLGWIGGQGFAKLAPFSWGSIEY
jgi:hypothetical protein